MYSYRRILMNTDNIENVWRIFLQELENKQAFSDFTNNNQMPQAERDKLFKNYLANWTKLHIFEKDIANRILSYAINIK